MVELVEEVPRSSMDTPIELRLAREGELEACSHGKHGELNWGRMS